MSTCNMCYTLNVLALFMHTLGFPAVGQFYWTRKRKQCGDTFVLLFKPAHTAQWNPIMFSIGKYCMCVLLATRACVSRVRDLRIWRATRRWLCGECVRGFYKTADRVSTNKAINMLDSSRRGTLLYSLSVYIYLYINYDYWPVCVHDELCLCRIDIHVSHKHYSAELIKFWIMLINLWAKIQRTDYDIFGNVHIVCRCPF